MRASRYGLRFEAGSFDAVVAANVLHLVPDLPRALAALEEVGDPADWEAICELEGKTSDRNAEAGNFQSIPVEERRSGPGSSPVMAAFAYAHPGRFNPPEFGAYYAGDSLLTALRERAYHASNFHRNGCHPPGVVENCRIYVGKVAGSFTNVKHHGEFHQSLNYAPGQALARDLRGKNHDGVLYLSVRNPGAECIAALRPSVVESPLQGRHFAFRFDGRVIVSATDYADGELIEL